MFDLSKTMSRVKSQDENKISIEKNKALDGIRQNICLVLRECKKAGFTRRNFTPQDFGADKYLSKQSVYDALVELGIAKKEQGQRRYDYPCVFESETRQKASSTVKTVTIFDIDKINSKS